VTERDASISKEETIPSSIHCRRAFGKWLGAGDRSELFRCRTHRQL
jgi:hypothetical protein